MNGPFIRCKNSTEVSFVLSQFIRLTDGHTFRSSLIPPCIDAARYKPKVSLRSNDDIKQWVSLNRDVSWSYRHPRMMTGLTWLSDDETVGCCWCRRADCDTGEPLSPCSRWPSSPLSSHTWPDAAAAATGLSPTVKRLKSYWLALCSHMSSITTSAAAAAASITANWSFHGPSSNCGWAGIRDINGSRTVARVSLTSNSSPFFHVLWPNADFSNII